MKLKYFIFSCLSSFSAFVMAAPSVNVLVEGTMSSMFNSMLSVMTTMGYVFGVFMMVSVVFGIYKSAQKGDIEGAVTSSVVKIGVAIMMMSAPQFMSSMLNEMSPFSQSTVATHERERQPVHQEQEVVVSKESKKAVPSPEGWDANVVSKAAWSEKGK